MPEEIKGHQPSQVEKGDIPPMVQETAQNQGVELIPTEALNKQYIKELRDLGETDEEDEQLVQLFENAKKLGETVAELSEDDSEVPASEETKKKLSEIRHELAINTFLLPTLGAAAFEMFNLAGGGTIAPPGLAIKYGLAIGSGIGGSLEGYALVKKGTEKLKTLIGRHKATEAVASQSPTPQIEERKSS